MIDSGEASRSDGRGTLPAKRRLTLGIRLLIGIGTLGWMACRMES